MVAVPANGHAEPALDAETIKRAFLDKLFSIQGKFPELATQHDYYLALAYTVRDLMLQPLGGYGRNVHAAAGTHGLLSLRRVPARAAAR